MIASLKTPTRDDSPECSSGSTTMESTYYLTISFPDRRHGSHVVKFLRLSVLLRGFAIAARTLLRSSVLPRGNLNSCPVRVCFKANALELQFHVRNWNVAHVKSEIEHPSRYALCARTILQAVQCSDSGSPRGQEDILHAQTHLLLPFRRCNMGRARHPDPHPSER